MGFLKTHVGIEAWLGSSSLEFRRLSQKEYAILVRKWRSRFEQMLIAGQCHRGNSAQEALENKLPCSVFVFSVPGYQLLPASTDARLDPAYAYEVDRLETLDFQVTNRADAIIVDQEFVFTCLCTHEAGGLARPEFCELR